jgi:hypothetical protein
MKAYRSLRNVGFVPEEVALCKEIVRLGDRLAGCSDNREKLQQMESWTTSASNLKLTWAGDCRSSGNHHIFQQGGWDSVSV